MTAQAMGDTPMSSQGQWIGAATRLRRNGTGMVGLAIVLVFLAIAALAPWMARYDPVAGSLAERLAGPTATHWMGTDLLGRDEWSRVIWGTRLSLVAGFGAVMVGLAIGLVIGGTAAGFGGRTDAVLMRSMDVLLAVPSVLLAIAIISALGRGLPQLMIAVGISNIPVFARLIRSSMLPLKSEEFILAAESMGSSSVRTLFTHLLPNSLGPVLVHAALLLSTAIVLVAGLGFLGFGPPDPSVPEWGTMLTEAAQFLREAPHLLLFPGLAISGLAVGFNLLGDGLREALDPRTRR